MIHIVKEKKGFAVKSVAHNGELLATSETLSSKAKCLKNIRAMNKNFIVGWPIVVQDDTLFHNKIIVVWPKARNITNREPKPRYQPGINPKKKKK